MTINNTTATTNTNTINTMNTMQTRVFAVANMKYKGKGFAVICKEQHGGSCVFTAPLSYKCLPNEKVVWSGTPMQFALDMPTFNVGLGVLKYTRTAYELVAE